MRFTKNTYAMQIFNFNKTLMLFATILGLWLMSIQSLVVAAELQIQPKIVGGVTGAASERPYMTALLTQSPNAMVTVNGDEYEALPFAGASFAQFSGELVDCELGGSSCTNANGKVCMIERGTHWFSEKAANCESGGGIGAIIYDNLDSQWIFRGEIEDVNLTIPVASVSKVTGSALLLQLGLSATVKDTSTVYEESFCGAAYIGDHWVVTAAHCVATTDSNKVAVSIGNYDLTSDNNSIYKAHHIIVHPNYDADKINNDIALIRLSEIPNETAITIINSVDQQQAINLNLDTVGMGWGIMSAADIDGKYADGSTPDVRYEITMPLVSNNTCEQSFESWSRNNNYSYSNNLTDGMICAGLTEGGYGTCYGDSGGPLVLEYGGQDYLVGLTSWGYGCAIAGLYDVFTRITHYEDFIQQYYSSVPIQAKSLLTASGSSTDNSSGSSTTNGTTTNGSTTDSSTSNDGSTTTTTSSSTSTGGGVWLWLPLIPALRRRFKR